MTVDPSEPTPEPESTSHELLKNIDRSLRLLIVILLVAAAVFGFWRWSEAQDREGRRRAYERCVEQNIRYSSATIKCHEP